MDTDRQLVGGQVNSLGQSQSHPATKATTQGAWAETGEEANKRGIVHKRSWCGAAQLVVVCSHPGGTEPHTTANVVDCQPQAVVVRKIHTTTAWGQAVWHAGCSNLAVLAIGQNGARASIAAIPLMAMSIALAGPGATSVTSHIWPVGYKAMHAPKLLSGTECKGMDVAMRYGRAVRQGYPRGIDRG